MPPRSPVVPARPLVVGEALGRGAPLGTRPLASGRALSLLADLSGLSGEEWLDLFETTNLIPGHAPDPWPPSVARAYASLIPVEERPGVILLGRKVAAAFDLARQPFFHWSGNLVVAPHPSGRSRWWNDPANRLLAGIFWRAVSEAALNHLREG